MNENIDLVEILKNCPRGTKLYSTVFGEVEFDKIDIGSNHPINISGKGGLNDKFTEDGRLCYDYDGECVLFPSKEQRDWSKFKPKHPKFDPKTLKPFDKVLGRNCDGCRWSCKFYSYKLEAIDEHVTTGEIYKYCIPYNDDTKHLVGTTKEAPEYYRYWED